MFLENELVEGITDKILAGDTGFINPKECSYYGEMHEVSSDKIKSLQTAKEPSMYECWVLYIKTLRKERRRSLLAFVPG